MFSKIPDPTNRLPRLLRCHRGNRDLVKLTVPANSKAKEATEVVVAGEAIKVVAAGDMIKVMAAEDTTKAVEVTNNVVIAEGTVVREVTEVVTETTGKVRIRIIRLTFS